MVSKSDFKEPLFVSVGITVHSGLGANKFEVNSTNNSCAKKCFPTGQPRILPFDRMKRRIKKRVEEKKMREYSLHVGIEREREREIRDRNYLLL